MNAATGRPAPARHVNHASAPLLRRILWLDRAEPFDPRNSALPAAGHRMNADARQPDPAYHVNRAVAPMLRRILWLACAEPFQLRNAALFAAAVMSTPAALGALAAFILSKGAAA